MANITNSTITSVEVSAKIMSELLELAKLREMAKGLKEREDAIRKTVLELGGSAEELTFEGMVIANLQHSVRTSTDTKELADKFPEAHKATLKATPQTRIIVL